MEKRQLTSRGHEGLEISRKLEFSMWSELGHWVGTLLRWKEKVCVWGRGCWSGDLSASC